MKNFALFVFLACCISWNICGAAAKGEIRKPQLLPTSAIYADCIPKLKEKYRDEIVFVAFEEAKKDTADFLNRLSEVCGGSEHSALWVTNCQNAVKSAKSDDWLEARNQLSLALGLERDLPDWLLMKAVADHKTGALSTTILDLEYLCKIRKDRKDGYKTLWETQSRLPDSYWYASKVLESYSNSSEKRSEH